MPGSTDVDLPVAGMSAHGVTAFVVGADGAWITPVTAASDCMWV